MEFKPRFISFDGDGTLINFEIVDGYGVRRPTDVRQRLGLLGL